MNDKSYKTLMRKSPLVANAYKVLYLDGDVNKVAKRLSNKDITFMYGVIDDLLSKGRHSITPRQSTYLASLVKKLG